MLMVNGATLEARQHKSNLPCVHMDEVAENHVTDCNQSFSSELFKITYDPIKYAIFFYCFQLFFPFRYVSTPLSLLSI